MVWIDSTFLVALLGWSIFSPFVCLFIGWWAGGEEHERVDIW